MLSKNFNGKLICKISLISYPPGHDVIFGQSRSQSYEINLVLKKYQLVLNSLTLCYLILDLTTVLLQSELR